MGFMGMHEWMACLQQGTLAPGLGLELDQPNLHLAPTLLDGGLNSPNSNKNKPKHTKSIIKQTYTQSWVKCS